MFDKECHKCNRRNHKYIRLSCQPSWLLGKLQHAQRQNVLKKRERSSNVSLPIPLTLPEIGAVLSQWVIDGVVTLLDLVRESTNKDKVNATYCQFHRYVHHPTLDCFTLSKIYHRQVAAGLLEVPNCRQRVDKNPLSHHQNAGAPGGVVNMFSHFGRGPSSVPIVELLDEPRASVVVRTLQRTPKFKSLFDQLGLPFDARSRATEVLMSIANESGISCLTAEAHANRAYLDSTNGITFTDEDMEANYPDH